MKESQHFGFSKPSSGLEDSENKCCKELHIHIFLHQLYFIHIYFMIALT